MSCAPVTSVWNMPDEILGKIFSYLPLADRKNVRLSCYQFYEACNQICIQKHEQIVFYGNISSDKAIRLLSRAERKFWNLKLNGGLFNDPCIMEFFEKQGAQIRSLSINSCEFSPTLLQNIIKCCKNLQYADFVFDLSIQTEYYENFFVDFKALQQDGVICQHVTSLTLDLPQSWLVHLSHTNSKILAFFAVFPSVRNLALTIEIDEYFDDLSTIHPVIPKDRLVFSCIHQCIQKISHQLEKLRLHFKYTLGRSYASIEMLHKICDIKMENLKELSLNWIDLWDASVRNPFSKLTSLTHFDCIIGDEMSEAVLHSSFLQLLLSTATELQTLRVKTIAGFFMDVECFQALVKSRLTSLTFYITGGIQSAPFVHSVKAHFEPQSVPENLMPNYTLKRLTMMSDCNLLLLFSTYFRRLQSLKVREVSNDILVNIFKLDLHTLEIYNHCKVPELHVPSLRSWLDKNEQHLSPHPFQNLTYLHILEDNRLELSEFLLAKFRFPKLKSLFIQTWSILPIDCSNCCYVESLWQSLQTLTQLESLEIRWNRRTTFQQWVALFSAVSKLRHFIIAEFNSRPFSKGEYVDLFRINSSLRSVHILKNNSVCGTFFKDAVSNTVVDKMWTTAYRLFQPVIVDAIPHYYEEIC